MKDRHRFRPLAVEDLETRVALSRAGGIAPVSPARLASTARNNAAQAVVNQVNLSFNSFTTDYLQAQGAYLAATTGASPSKGARTAFKNFVAQRVDLLAAQLTRVFAHVPGSLTRLQTSSSGGPVVVQEFLNNRINGTTRTSLLETLEGGRGNPGAIPPAGTSGPAATIYTDQAISAIETAQTSSLNSLGFLYGGSFNKHR
jgi:hypothetical protein